MTLRRPAGQASEETCKNPHASGHHSARRAGCSEKVQRARKRKYSWKSKVSCRNTSSLKRLKNVEKGTSQNMQEKEKDGTIRYKENSFSELKKDPDLQHHLKVLSRMNFMRKTHIISFENFSNFQRQREDFKTSQRGTNGFLASKLQVSAAHRQSSGDT